MDVCRWRKISFINMAVIPLEAWDVPAVNITFVQFVQQYNFADDQTVDIRVCSEFLFWNVSIWLPRHLASHRNPLILFTALRAANCVCDLSCCVWSVLLCVICLAVCDLSCCVWSVLLCVWSVLLCVWSVLLCVWSVLLCVICLAVWILPI